MPFTKLITDKTYTKWLEAEVKISLTQTWHNNELNCWTLLAFCWEQDLEREKPANERPDFVLERTLR